jgi:hypothetical protein
MSLVAATLENFEEAASEWRQDAALHRDGGAFFYFAGHGVSRGIPNDAVMLLADFRSSSSRYLKNAVEVADIKNAMIPTISYPEMARNQLYCIDSCRLVPQDVNAFIDIRVDRVFDIELNHLEDNRKIGMFYAANPGTSTDAVKDHLTYFSTGLLECLNRLGGERADLTDRWSVSVNSLIWAMRKYFKQLEQQ